MYKSVQFEKNMVTAMLMGDPFILSAKHELLYPEQRIDPYDEWMGDKTRDERIEWAKGVVRDLPDQYDNLVFFAGKKYRYPIQTVLDSSEKSYTVYSPFEHTSGNGEQMNWVDTVRNQLRNGASIEEVCHD